MFRRRKHGIAEAVGDWPVSLFCFDLLYDGLFDGGDLTRLPYAERRDRLERAVTASGRLHLATAENVGDLATLETLFQQSIADGCEGLLCKSLADGSGYQAGARGWQWIKLKREYRSELNDTIDLVVVGAFHGRGRRRGTYGAVLLAAYDPASDQFRTVCKCGTGFSDAELAALPGRLAHLVSPQRPARVDSRVEADVWFDPSAAPVLEVLGAELTPSPNHTAGWGRVKSALTGTDDAGLALRFPRFTGRYRDDKGPEDATTVDEVLAMYQAARREPES
jgi:DNA ligase-1